MKIGMNHSFARRIPGLLLLCLLLTLALGPARADAPQAQAPPNPRVPAVLGGAHAVTGAIVSISPAEGKLTITNAATDASQTVTVNDRTIVSKRALPAQLSDFAPGEKITVLTDDEPSSPTLAARAVMDARFAFFYLAKVVSSYMYPATVLLADPAKLTVTVQKEDGTTKTLKLTPLSMIVLNNAPADLSDLRQRLPVIVEAEFLGFPEDEPQQAFVRGIFDQSSFIDIKNSLIFGPLLGKGEITSVDDKAHTLQIGGMTVSYDDNTQWLSDVSPAKVAHLRGNAARVYGFPMENGQGYTASLVLTENMVPILARNLEDAMLGKGPEVETLVEGSVISVDPAKGMLVVENAGKGGTTGFERIYVTRGTTIVKGVFSPADLLALNPATVTKYTLADIKPGDTVLVRGLKADKKIATFISLK